jgi:hypothetical protein
VNNIVKPGKGERNEEDSAYISVVAVAAILVVTGCTTPTGQGSKTYTRGQARAAVVEVSMQAPEHNINQ